MVLKQPLSSHSTTLRFTVDVVAAQLTILAGC